MAHPPTQRNRDDPDAVETIATMFDIEHIKCWAPSKDRNRTKVFALKVGYIYISEPLMEKIKHLTNNPDPVTKLPVLPVLSAGKERFGLIGRKLRKFAEEEQDHQLGTNPDTCFYIGLVPLSSTLDDGTITIIEHEEESSEDDTSRKYKKVMTISDITTLKGAEF